MTSISEFIAHGWEGVNNNPNLSQRHKTALLALIADYTNQRLDMASNGGIVENGIKFAYTKQSPIGNRST
jgi:cellulase/cellobiase CelA1